MAINAKIPVDVIAVLPDSIPLAISLVLQYATTGLKIRTYAVKLPINPHVPNSSCVNCLVTINVKIKPVKTLARPTTKDKTPE